MNDLGIDHYIIDSWHFWPRCINEISRRLHIQQQYLTVSYVRVERKEAQMYNKKIVCIEALTVVTRQSLVLRIKRVDNEFKRYAEYFLKWLDGIENANKRVLNLLNLLVPKHK